MNYVKELDRRWRTYFNWTILYPSVGAVAFSAVAAYFIYEAVVKTMENPTSALDASSGSIALGFLGGAAFIFSFGLLSLLYVAWFIVASDGMFRILGMNRLASNALNLLGLFLLPGISFLITPVVLLSKVKSAWRNAGIECSFSGKLKQRPTSDDFDSKIIQ